MAQAALILGATGRFGRKCAEAFQKAGWRVKTFDRAHGDLAKETAGVDVIVNGWNPAYPDWAAQVPALHAKVIHAAKTHDATVLLPGNVYVFGEITPAPWSEHSAHAATNPLGLIRARMEDAYRSSGVRTILLRAGDFIDTERSGNWFDAVMTKKLGRGTFVYPGDPDIDHAWAYLPDVARAAVALAEKRDALDRFTDVPFPGYTLSGHQMADAIAAVSGARIDLTKMSWWPVSLARPVWPMGRCLNEMRYLWNVPHSLDGTRFRALLPGFRDTPFMQALAATRPVMELSASPTSTRLTTAKRSA